VRFLLVSAACAAFAASLNAAPPLPPPAAGPVDFAKHVRPILEQSCIRCHARGSHKGGLSVETRKDLLDGGETGPAAVPGKSGESLLIQLVSGQEEERVMPAKGPRLTGEQIGVLRAWIDQGAAWPDGFSFGFPRAALAPRTPSLPAVAGVDHPIDRLLQAYYREHKVNVADVVPDRVYARRVYLDLIGLLPTPDELSAFEQDTRPEKRRLLVEKLLADRRNYADHWLTFWNDALRNAYRGTGFIDGGRKQITDWLYAALYDNKPYDRFVRELVSAAPGAEGFTKGIIWRGVVNASQAPPVQAAQNVAQVFLGTNLKCASCHDSFVNHWRLKEAYSLAAVFADGPLEINRCDKPTGKKAEAACVFPELGRIDPAAPKADRQRRLADILTKRDDGRLARTIVNRLWAQLLGRGLVEPIDDMDQPAWHADLLDWLAADLADHGYDLKHTVALICTSRAYQLPAVGSSPDAKDFTFTGPLVKRMTAEQFLDAVATLTGVWPEQAAVPLTRGHGEVRFDSGVMRSGAKAVDVDVRGAALLRLTVTDAGDGKSNDWADWAEPVLETPDGPKKLTELPWIRATCGHGKVQIDKNTVEKPLRVDDKPAPFGFGTHAASDILFRLPPGATRFRATVGPDTEAVETKKTKVSVRFLVTVEGEEGLRVRAALLNDDELTRALGRPLREQVVTRRDSLATLLQALELTNGERLDGILRQGAAHLLSQPGATADAVIDHVYRVALGRTPTDAERRVARELVGSPASPAGVADLLWAVAMLPEFQLVY
jgi:mono/diheme cytochrome c family protein